MDRTTLRNELKRRAHAEGFDRIGVADACRLDRDQATLERWLDRGYQADMEWMERHRERRGDPRELLPGCRSVVVLAMNYGPGKEAASPSPAAGRVARYARGRDYHKVLGRRLRRLCGWLDEVSGLHSRTFVDTAPVLERGWAERAGVGWIGKNANLISRDLGSWMMIGEILTQVHLPPDTGPHEEFCGTCNACIDACPTDAIVEPGLIDSRACIAYWTIERRGEIPPSHRAGIGDWIFGCDVCQEVCPWNDGFARERTDDVYERRDDLTQLDAVAILEMDEAEFRERYSGTALMRAKWQGMRRNACVVLGNQGCSDALPALRRAIADPDPVVREHAAWAVRQIENRAT